MVHENKFPDYEIPIHRLLELTPEKEEQLANELIDDYQELQTMLNTVFDDILRPAVESFYKHLYFRRRLKMDRLQPILIGLTAFLNYASGLIDKAELKRNIIIFNLIKIKSIEIDSMKFALSGYTGIRK